MDWDIKDVKGVLDADTISFANDYGMFAVATRPDAEEILYSRGWFQDAAVVMFDGHFITGIKDVNVALEEKGKNSKTYNMMVSRLTPLQLRVFSSVTVRSSSRNNHVAVRE